MKFFRKLENLLSAAAFAEEGEFETAREMIRGDEVVEREKAPAKGVFGRKKRTSSSSSRAA